MARLEGLVRALGGGAVVMDGGGDHGERIAGRAGGEDGRVGWGCARSGGVFGRWFWDSKLDRALMLLLRDSKYKICRNCGG